MSASEQSLKAKMALLRAKKEAAAAAATGGAATVASLPATTAAASIAPTPNKAVPSVSITTKSAPVIQNKPVPMSVKPVPHPIATVTQTNKPLSLKLSMKPVNVIAAPTKSIVSNSAPKSSQTQTHPPNKTSSVPAAANAGAGTAASSSAPPATQRRRLHKLSDINPNGSDKSASSASAAVAASSAPAKSVPSIAPTMAQAQSQSTKLVTVVPTGGLKRKKMTSGPSQPVEVGADKNIGKTVHQQIYV
jgi:hypothetical protein